jgi:hypothetical protein
MSSAVIISGTFVSESGVGRSRDSSPFCLGLGFLAMLGLWIGTCDLGAFGQRDGMILVVIPGLVSGQFWAT